MKQRRNKVIELTQAELTDLENSCEEVEHLQDGSVRFTFDDGLGKTFTTVSKEALDHLRNPGY